MTDLEINKALALAIGYLPEHVKVVDDVILVQRALRGNPLYSGLHNFDYKDWQTIGPIAEWFDCFPFQPFKPPAKWAVFALNDYVWVYADTPQKAIAMAVIAKEGT